MSNTNKLNDFKDKFPIYISKTYGINESKIKESINKFANYAITDIENTLQCILESTQIKILEIGKEHGMTKDNLQNYINVTKQVLTRTCKNTNNITNLLFDEVQGHIFGGFKGGAVFADEDPVKITNLAYDLILGIPLSMLFSIFATAANKRFTLVDVTNDKGGLSSFIEKVLRPLTGGGRKLKKSTKKLMYKGVNRCVYIGKRGGQYVKIKDQYILIPKNVR